VTTDYNRARSAAAEAAFRARLAELGAELLEPLWLGNHARHRVRCAAGHGCAPTPANVWRGQGICRECAGQHSGTAEATFRARVADLGGLVLGEYRGARLPVACRCASGHDCAPWPTAVQRGQGICQACSSRAPSQIAEAAFRARIADLGGLVLGEYGNGAVPVACRCASGHDCAPRPSTVQQGEGICRRCQGRDWDVFYVVASADGDRVKLGITGEGGRRLRDHRAAGYPVVVRLWVGLPGDLAPELERAALAALRLAGLAPIRGREYFDYRALPVVLDIADNWPGISDHPADTGGTDDDVRDRTREGAK
jgi:hypothetical protein